MFEGIKVPIESSQTLMIKVLFILVTLILPGIVLSQSAAGSAGTSSAIFLRSTLSTRVAGLSEAFAGIADDENAILYNPAGLGKSVQNTFALNHTEWLEDIRFANLIYTHRITSGFSAGISLAHMYMPDIPRILDASGTTDGSITVSSSIVNIGAGLHLFRGFYIGSAVKFFNDNLAGKTTNGLAFDAGIYSNTFVHGLTFGAALQNMGAKVKYIKKSYEIPLTYRVGFAYNVSGLPLTIGLDAVKSVDSGLNINLGSEYTFNRMIHIQAGNQVRADAYFTPTFGIGFSYDSYSLGYSFSSPSEIGISHRIGFKYEFGSARSSVYLPSSSKTLLRAPANVSAKIENNILSLNWTGQAGLYYNVYAKDEMNKWVKLTTSPIRDSHMELKNPTKGKTYKFCVTGLKNGKESAYSREAIIYVKK